MVIDGGWVQWPGKETVKRGAPQPVRVGSSASVYVELVDVNPLWATLAKPLGWRRAHGG